KKNIAKTKGQVVRRIKKFMASDNRASKRLRSEIIEPLQSLGEVCIIGGLVRDIAIYGIDNRPISDIDLVVRTKRSQLVTFASRFDALPNRFGGYGVRTNAYRADFWAFNSTWAKVEGHVALHAA